MNCNPQSLLAAARCLSCLPPRLLIGVRTSLLCQIANASTYPCGAPSNCIRITGSGTPNVDGLYVANGLGDYVSSPDNGYLIVFSGPGWTIIDTTVLHPYYATLPSAFPCTWSLYSGTVGPAPTGNYEACVPVGPDKPLNPVAQFQPGIFASVVFSWSQTVVPDFNWVEFNHNGGGWFPLIHVPGATTTTTEIGIHPGDSWCYRVRAQTGGVYGPYSDIVCVLYQFVIDDGTGTFWKLVADNQGNIGTMPDAGPATADIILADGSGGFWKVVVDIGGLRGTQADAGPASLTPNTISDGTYTWTLSVDNSGNLGAY